ncbi:MAG TPA: STM3941 family protein [Alphaproteobacteria bacterium]|nr:STM3941 family protein [Alphaproteobacteria bacterium]
MSDIDEMLTPDAFVCYPHRGKLLLIALGAVAFVVSSLFLWHTGNFVDQMIAVLAVTFFGVCFLWAVFRILRPRPALVINYAGICDNSSVSGAGLVRWHEVKAIGISVMRIGANKQRFLSIYLKDNEEFLRRQPSLKARAMRVNLGLLGTPICISAVSLPLSLDELILQVRQKVPDIPFVSSPDVSVP